LNPPAGQRERRIGLFSATSIGVGAIVGGGVLALAGTAFAATGPSAVLAFALNGLISIVTALSFAELSTAFPQSGGTYVFAKRVLSVGAAFSVGWIVWFASIVAAALYALGFAAFALGALSAIWPDPPAWVGSGAAVPIAATLAVTVCTAALSKSTGSGGSWINVLKILVFGILIAGGFWAWFRDAPPVAMRLTPFLPLGMVGLLQAMGYTYIALQGFDLIAAVAGEVKEPRRVLPRAILFSLGAALAVYLPLLLLVAVSGIPHGETLSNMAQEHPDTILAVAARTWLGPFGFWLVIAAGLLSMLSALIANLFAGSRIALAMARDRTLPPVLERVSVQRAIPARALLITGLLAALIGVVTGNVAAAGAAASLIFLVSFALAHLICILARKRQPNHPGFRAPGWPFLPAAGGVACLALAIFQGVAVPAAGLIAGAWLAAGFFSYLWVFGRRARVLDAASEMGDPDLLELRGRSPLALVPVANPANAGALALLAAHLSPPRTGRVLFLNVVRPPREGEEADGPEVMADILRRSLEATVRTGVHVECLATVAEDPWREIPRVARAHRCVVTLLGMADLSNVDVQARLETLAGTLPGNVVMLKAPEGWHADSVKRVLVPIGGRSMHIALRARLLTALTRHAPEGLAIRYLVVVPEGQTTEVDRERMRLVWSDRVRDETDAPAGVEVVEGNDVAGVVISRAEGCDLVLLGLSQVGRRQRVFSDLIKRIVEAAPGAVLLLGQRE
jgi:amino acid transporter